MFLHRTPLILILFSIFTTAIYLKRSQTQMNLIRICMNFEISGLQTTCVLCDVNRYLQTLMSCIGQSALPSNTNGSQAFCLINLCQTQVSQIPLTLGKRDISDGALDLNDTFLTLDTMVENDIYF